MTFFNFDLSSNLREGTFVLHMLPRRPRLFSKDGEVQEVFDEPPEKHLCLLVAVENYENQHKLQSAENDAKGMYQFLVE